MAFVTLEDLYGTVEIIVFPTIYQNVKPYLIEDNGLYVKGGHPFLKKVVN